jgi:hypothetical protein
MTFENSPYYFHSESKRRKLLNLNSSISLLINVMHCKGEYSLMKHVIKTNGWKETSAIGKGHIFWYGSSMNENDKQLMNNRSCWYNRYVGAGYLSYKRPFGEMLNNALKLFP